MIEFLSANMFGILGRGLKIASSRLWIFGTLFLFWAITLNKP